jgi:hypothetical protein
MNLSVSRSKPEPGLPRKAHWSFRSTECKMLQMPYYIYSYITYTEYSNVFTHRIVPGIHQVDTN